MDCTNNMTIEEFFELYWRWFNKIWCNDQYKLMLNILWEFWIEYATMPRNIASFAVNSESTEYSVTEPIRDIEGFYSSKAPSCKSCFKTIENACGGKKYKLAMQPSMSPWFIVQWEYDFCMDWTKLSAALPGWVTDWFVRYYKSYKLDPGLKEKNKLPIPQSMMFLLKKLLAKEYTLLSWDRYQWIDQMYWNEFTNGIAKIKDRTARSVIKIENPIETNAQEFNEWWYF